MGTDFQKRTSIVFVGLADAGKTTLLNRLVTGEIRATPPTMGFSIDNFEYEEKIQIRAIDLGGQDIFIHSLWNQFIPKADVVVFLIDSANHELMEKARDTFLTVISWIQEKEPIVMLLANKQDISSAYTLEEVIQVLNLTELTTMPVKALQMFDCSAKTGHGVTEAFDWLVNQLTQTVEIPRAHVHQVYVYESSGVLLSSRITQPFAEGNSSIDPTLVTGFYSALSGFAKEITGKGLADTQYQGIRSVIIHSPIPGSPDLRLTHVEDKDHNLACLVVAEEEDSPSAIRAVAESALAISRSCLEKNPHEIIPEELLEQHISPFIYPPPILVDTNDFYEKKPLNETNDYRKSFDPTFFTTLTVWERVKAIEGNDTSISIS